MPLLDCLAAVDLLLQLVAAPPGMDILKRSQQSAPALSRSKPPSREFE
ncbi:hypothetical protein C882_1900 [Caenispirillum salinarum AK4]|uniref:Uncharacterized protein n=1 Tax=Caenispirillum salinarum AK4 TaxID=1238182 RepID=K9H9V2_9PROT|nr:hypothetical protein C882_1900 [Caenispirillum salinarum AK4]